MLHNRNIYNGYLDIIQIQEITDFWAKLHYVEVKTNTNKLQIASSGAEYTADSLNLYGYSVQDKIIEVITNLNPKNCIVFVPSVKQAQELAKIIPNSAWVAGEQDKKERAKVITAFKLGEIDIVFNVNLLSVGFDYPSLKYVIDAVPTLSLSRYYQKLGRLVRICNLSGKYEGTVVDIAGNKAKFGKIECLEFKLVGSRYHIFNEYGYQMTNVNLSEIGKKESNAQSALKGFSDIIFAFGQYKGKKISQVPHRYLYWVLGESTDSDLCRNIQLYLSLKIFSDEVIEFGKWKGKKISEVPQSYLRWMIDSVQGNMHLIENAKIFLDI
jgi:superfamily II DNA or RNA helicase